VQVTSFGAKIFFRKKAKKEKPALKEYICKCARLNGIASQTLRIYKYILRKPRRCFSFFSLFSF
jgi:hypothetical protein